jgi:hypothetical protein
VLHVLIDRLVLGAAMLRHKASWATLPAGAQQAASCTREAAYSTDLAMAGAKGHSHTRLCWL